MDIEELILTPNVKATLFRATPIAPTPARAQRSFRLTLRLLEPNRRRIAKSTSPARVNRIAAKGNGGM